VRQHPAPQLRAQQLPVRGRINNGHKDALHYDLIAPAHREVGSVEKETEILLPYGVPVSPPFHASRSSLYGNQLCTLVAMMPHNLGREIQMGACERDRGTAEKRAPLWRFESLRRIRHRLIKRARAAYSTQRQPHPHYERQRSPTRRTHPPARCSNRRLISATLGRLRRFSGLRRDTEQHWHRSGLGGELGVKDQPDRSRRSTEARSRMPASVRPLRDLRSLCVRLSSAMCSRSRNCARFHKSGVNR